MFYLNYGMNLSVKYRWKGETEKNRLNLLDLGTCNFVYIISRTNHFNINVIQSAYISAKYYMKLKEE